METPGRDSDRLARAPISEEEFCRMVESFRSVAEPMVKEAKRRGHPLLRAAAQQLALGIDLMELQQQVSRKPEQDRTESETQRRQGELMEIDAMYENVLVHVAELRGRLQVLEAAKSARRAARKR